MLFFVTEDWYFHSHRLPLAQAALAAGYQVVLVTRVRRHGELISSCGITVIPLELARSGINPLRELTLLGKLLAIYRRERPDIVHHVAMKPVLYGTLVARLVGVPMVVNALAGLGFLFSSRHLIARLLAPLVKQALRLLAGGNSHIIVQNPDDMRLLLNLTKVPAERVYLLSGVGVDLHTFRPVYPPPIVTVAGPIVLFSARFIWDKGLMELVQAINVIRSSGVAVRCVLVGAPDLGNPAAVPEAQVQGWVAKGLVEWWGFRDDMPTVLQQSHIVCLPSYYGEGLPKALAEAAACGLPIVTTDIPGCREVVQDGHNGLLVPVRNPQALADALITLLRDPQRRLAYGQASRTLAEARFGSTTIIAATLAIYQKLH